MTIVHMCTRRYLSVDQSGNVGLSTDNADPATVFRLHAVIRVSPYTECKATGGQTPGKPCIFPFTARGVTYESCTWDLSHLTESKPWCSTKVDSNGVHVRGNVGTCETSNCPIPPRRKLLLALAQNIHHSI